MGMLIDSLTQAIAAHENSPGFFRECPAGVVSLGAENVCLPGESVDIAAHVQVLSGADVPLARARVAVLAHWSAEGEPDAALRHLLAALRAQGFTLVAACGCRPQNLTLWTSLVDVLLWRSCTGYDFTSWKAAFAVLPDLYVAEEVLCLNDSVFGPINPLGPVHAAMNAVDCDFWGLVESREKRRHLQSYYMLYRPAVLRHPAFRQFWDCVDTNADKFAAVLRYEVFLAPWLEQHGLRPAAFVPSACFPDTNVNPCHYFWRPLLTRFGMPFLKRDLLRRARNHPFVHGWEQVLAKQGYDPALCLLQAAL